MGLRWQLPNPLPGSRGIILNIRLASVVMSNRPLTLSQLTGPMLN